MSFLRKLVFFFVSSETAAKMQAESRRWLATCPNCRRETSIWDLGGLRYKAAGTKTTRLRCAGCGQTGWHAIAYRAQ